MSQHLPDQFDPWRFTDLEKHLGGAFALKSLPRLRDCLTDSQGEVRFSLEFFRDHHQRACMRGTVAADLSLQCQRCLERLVWPVRSRVSVAFVEGFAEAENLPDALDPVMVEGGRVRLRALIEDELLLALPQIPMHPADQCVSRIEADEAEAGERAVRENPFAVLAELKRHDK